MSCCSDLLMLNGDAAVAASCTDSMRWIWKWCSISFSQPNFHFNISFHVSFVNLEYEWCAMSISAAESSRWKSSCTLENVYKLFNWFVVWLNIVYCCFFLLLFTLLVSSSSSCHLSQYGLLFLLLLVRRVAVATCTLTKYTYFMTLTCLSTWKFIFRLWLIYESNFRLMHFFLSFLFAVCCAVLFRSNIHSEL